jgi:hypothetical protein
MTALSCANQLHFLTFRIFLVASMDKLSGWGAILTMEWSYRLEVLYSSFDLALAYI